MYGLMRRCIVIYSAKIRKGKILVERLKARRESSKAKRAALTKPVYDLHYTKFVEKLNEDN